MTATNELLIATFNPGKLREYSRHLVSLPFRRRSLAEFSEVVKVEETGSTFAENAALKAKAYSAQTKLWCIADDSGLEVDALGGAPGVRSARYGGEGATDVERNSLLLSELSLAGGLKRSARFVCVIAVADSEGGLINSFVGTCEGRIAHESRGANGFGYDPIFIPAGYTQTFGELPDSTKIAVSHRAHAIKAASSFLFNHLKSYNLTRTKLDR